MENTALSYLIKIDLARYTKTTKSIFCGYIKEPYFRYVFWLRVVHRLKEKRLLPLAILPYIILKQLSYKFGVFIDSNISIGPGLHVVHGNGVYINAKSIGRNFTVYQGVTLGCANGECVPTVSDNVTVYAGAKVLGDVHLGSNSTVGANAVVTHSVGDGLTVAGVPARVIIPCN